MNNKETDQESLHISRKTLLTFVSTFLGGGRGREDDENPLPPGPWDPVIRVALERVTVFGPRPEPWKVALASIFARHSEIFDAIGGGHNFGDEVALNPQPLPPRFAFLVALAQTVISRAELIQEIAGATAREGQQQGIIIVGGYTSRFSDEFCGTGFRLRWPFPGPRPNWFAKELDGIDLVVMGAQFEKASKEAFSPDVRQSLAAASKKFVDAGLSKLR